MATTVPEYDKDRTGTAAGTGALGGVLAGAATGAAIGAPAGGVAAIPGAVIGGILGGVLSGTAAGVNEDAAQKSEIASATRTRRSEQDATMDAAHNAKAAGATGATPDYTSSASASPYSAGNAYDTWHAQKWG